MKPILAVIVMACSAAFAGADPRESRQPVIVELFTSEGCSSCPPADALLARIAAEQSNKRAQVIPLSFHVDYWNELGWPDPFSSASYSQRQSDYSKVFARRGSYTPQMIVDGKDEFVGSDATKAAAAISAAASDSKGRLAITLSPAVGGDGGISVSVAGSRAEDDSEPMTVVLAVTEDHLETQVPRGENSGRRLKHAAVVRKFLQLGEIPTKSGPFTLEARVDIALAWKRADLNVVAFVQAAKTRRIFAAGTVRLAK